MSLEFMDGFDHQGGVAKWDSFSSFFAVTSPVHFPSGGAGLPSISVVAGNTLGASLTAAGSNILAPVATRTIGVAVYWAGFSTNTIVRFMDLTTTQLDVRLTLTGAIAVTRNGTVLATSARVFVTGRWYYLEFQATINSATGSYTVKVTDGGASTVWLTASGVNTQETANATMDGVQFPSTGSAGSNLIDDVYILNSAGATNNTFLGECRVITAMPTSDGATLQWTPNSGTAHFSRVNETPPDGDTSYNSTATPGNIDLYGYPAITSTGGALAMQINMDARKDDLGSRSIASQYKSGGGTSYTGSTDVIASNFIIYRQIYETDPDTGLAWTYVNINAAKFGVKCIA